jgi:hypothetical protein
MPDIETKEVSYLTNIIAGIDVDKELREEFTLRNVEFLESLLMPGLQTTLNFDSVSSIPEEVKNYDEFRGAEVHIEAKRPILDTYNDTEDATKFTNSFISDNLQTSQVIFKMTKRKRKNNAVDGLTLVACDPSMIYNKLTRLTAQYYDEPADLIIRKILAKTTDEIKTNTAQMIDEYTDDGSEPFRSVARISNMALSARGNDPSFLHWMTYKKGDDAKTNTPTHHWESLDELVRKPVEWIFTYSDKVRTDDNYANPKDVMDYEFPTDFDFLSDINNGYNVDGSFNTKASQVDTVNGTAAVKLPPLNSTDSSWNPLKWLWNGFNFGNKVLFNTMQGEGPTIFTTRSSVDPDTDQARENNRTAVRKARLSLLAKDRINLRFRVAFNPNISAGSMVRFLLLNRDEESSKTDKYLYGSGDYLVSSLVHTVKLGGLGYTVMDCVSNSKGLDLR